MIPSVVHFVWLGSRLPWVYRLALRSAIERAGVSRVILHHEKNLEDLASLRVEGVECRCIDPQGQLAPLPEGEQLLARFAELRAPAARSNVLRAAILYQEGGIYLDLDTVTVASLDSLRADDCFCGRESLVYSAAVVDRLGRPLTRRTATLRSKVREVCATVPGGWRTFRRLQGWYPQAANNAVMGSVPHHPLFRDLLHRMTKVPGADARQRYALGTRLLQRALTNHTGVKVHPSPCFYPLGPVVARQWFQSSGLPAVDQMLDRRTRVVHWYASDNAELIDRIDAAYILEHQEHQPFSSLAAPLVDVRFR